MSEKKSLSERISAVSKKNAKRFTLVAKVLQVLAKKTDRQNETLDALAARVAELERKDNERA